VVPEAPLKESEHGLFAGGAGWFVLNMREARWWDRALGFEASIGGEGDFPQVGVGLAVLAPGDPMAMYHWESDEEDFLVLAGEALLIIEGEERPLRQWDFVHCPPETQHVIVGAGTRPCVVLGIGARERHTERGPDGRLRGREGGSAYTVSEAAIRHGAGVEQETTDAEEAYARVRKSRHPEPMPYHDGWLPTFEH
jgi:uncharacterized cupin superfamily protein